MSAVLSDAELSKLVLNHSKASWTIHPDRLDEFSGCTRAEILWYLNRRPDMFVKHTDAYSDLPKDLGMHSYMRQNVVQQSKEDAVIDNYMNLIEMSVDPNETLDILRQLDIKIETKSLKEAEFNALLGASTEDVWMYDDGSVQLPPGYSRSKLIRIEQKKKGMPSYKDAMGFTWVTPPVDSRPVIVKVDGVNKMRFKNGDMNMPRYAKRMRKGGKFPGFIGVFLKDAYDEAEDDFYEELMSDSKQAMLVSRIILREYHLRKGHVGRYTSGNGLIDNMVSQMQARSRVSLTPVAALLLQRLRA